MFTVQSASSLQNLLDDGKVEASITVCSKFNSLLFRPIPTSRYNGIFHSTCTTKKKTHARDYDQTGSEQVSLPKDMISTERKKKTHARDYDQTGSEQVSLPKDMIIWVIYITSLKVMKNN